MSVFYTKTGDDGTTGLLSGERVTKFDLRIEVLGSLDELSAVIGLARSLNTEPVNSDLKNVQVTLYEMMSEIASLPENAERFAKITDDYITKLEAKIADYSAVTNMPSEFVLSGDHSCSAAISMARSIARRAERRLVELGNEKMIVRGVLYQYINRLSSFLYILEIHTALSEGNGTITLAKKKEA